MSQLVLDTELEAPIELVGGKARGILTLKSLEERLNEEVVSHGKVIVPSFFVVPSSINLAGSYRDILEVADSLGSERYAVRSSSVLEDDGAHSFDGIFDTYLDVSRDELVRKIHHVRKSARSEKAIRYADEIGVELDERIPVIVQAMVDKKDHTGVVYSKFPASRDIVKIIRESANNGERYIEAFLRKYNEDGTVTFDINSPLVISKDYSEVESIEEIKRLVDIALFVERELQHRIIMEFATCRNSENWQFYPLQARKLTQLSESEKFQMPELQEKGLIATTYDLNGTGDFTGKAFSIAYDRDYRLNVDGLNEFDRRHPEGYVLVTPFLEFDGMRVDHLTPNKKAVVAHQWKGLHHDLEISRKKGILYLNANNSLSHHFYKGKRESSRPPIETGDIVRAVSNGEKGFVYNLSRV